MQSHARISLVRCVALATTLSFLVSPAFGQASRGSGNDGWSAFVSPAYQFDSDVDGGDELHVDRLSLGMNHQGSIGQALRTNFALRYEYQDWDFGEAGAFGGAAPWEELHRVTLSAQVSRPLGGAWQISGGPIVGFAGEDGASSDDAFVYGGLVSAARRISPDLTLGLGVAVAREIEKTRTTPIVIVSWQITDRLSLQNALPNAPTGPAGLELGYQLTGQWQIAGGGGFRRARYRLDERLDEDGPSAGGVADTRSFPVFARATRAIGESAALSIYAGALLGGELRLEDADGEWLAEDEYDAAPIVALSLSSRF